MPNHGSLIEWGNQGVLLLNRVLTVEDSKPNSHRDLGWLKFTTYVIKIINENKSSIVFMLWGNQAQ